MYLRESTVQLHIRGADECFGGRPGFVLCLEKAKFSSAVAIDLNKSDHGTLQNMRDKFMQGERYILCSLCNAILQVNVRPVDC
jgi:hypothetical protein